MSLKVAVNNTKKKKKDYELMAEWLMKELSKPKKKGRIKKGFVL